MENCYIKNNARRNGLLILLLFLLLGLGFGCQTQEPPLSPAAARFKAEVKDCIHKLAQPLTGPVLSKDRATIIDTLRKTEPEAIKLCRMCPFRMGVMGPNGDTLAVYPPKNAASLDFYNYEVVQQALRTRKVTQQRLFLQNGSRLYVICIPLLKNDRIIGLLALALSASDAKNRWGLTEKEFLSLDFNR